MKRWKPRCRYKKPPVTRFCLTCGTQSSEELQKNASNHPRRPQKTSLSSVSGNQAGKMQGEDEEAMGHVPPLDPPFITSVRIGWRKRRELPVSVERPSKRTDFYLLSCVTLSERKRERLVLKIAATDTD
ncbi:unnamed protein product [Leuciscus chuanchicus]